MRPIEHRTDETFNQALSCVGFRLPLRSGLKPAAMELALGLRYGLIGAAAAHYLLLSCPDQFEQMLLANLTTYGDLVEEHVRQAVMKRLPYGADPNLPSRVGTLAREPLLAYLPLYRRLCPLELCLSVACDEYARNHKQNLSGWNWFRRRKELREFQTIADQSFGFALCFFERRQADLEEVAEIALLGE